ncbi:MAG: hypothetical protein ABIL11_12495 [Chloroflexota bacterium]
MQISGAVRRNVSEPGGGRRNITALRSYGDGGSGSPIGGGRAGEAGGDDLRGLPG